MGTCGSKCCFTSPTPSISDPESPHDKAIIFSDPLPLITPSLPLPPLPSKDPFSDTPKNHSKFQIHPSPPILSSSSSNSTTPTSSSISTGTTTTSNTTTTTTSYTSSYSTDNSYNSRPNHSDTTRPPLKKKSFSSEFLLSCVENSNIVILDPNKGTKENPVDQAQFPKFSEIPITTSQYLSVTATRAGVTTSSLRQRTSTSTNTNSSMRNSQSNNTKRARSVSPASRTGHKVIKPDPCSYNPVSSNIIRPRTAEIIPPQWRPVNSQRGSLNALTGPVTRPVSAIKKDLKGPTMEKEVKERQVQDAEVASRERVNTPPPVLEDLNNPLIAMDCFIFL